MAELKPREAHQWGTLRRPTVAISDANTELQRIAAYAVEVFGDQDAGMRWLQRKNPLLGDRSPSEVIDAGDGNSVEELLIRIDEGIFV